MAPVHRRMRAFFFGVTVTLLATAAGRATAEGSASSVDHAAKHGGGDKGDKRCSALSNDCGFLTASDLASTEGAAIFSLTTDAEGDVSCDVVDAAEGTGTGCQYNEATETFEMAVQCPEGFVVASTVCAPYLTEGESTILDVFGTQNVVNTLHDVLLCGMPVSAPIPPDSEFAFLLGARCEPDFGYVNDNTGDDDDGGNALKKTLMPTADKLEGLAAKMLAAKAAKKN